MNEAWYHLLGHIGLECRNLRTEGLEAWVQSIIKDDIRYWPLWPFQTSSEPFSYQSYLKSGQWAKIRNKAYSPERTHTYTIVVQRFKPPASQINENCANLSISELHSPVIFYDGFFKFLLGVLVIFFVEERCHFVSYVALLLINWCSIRSAKVNARCFLNAVFSGWKETIEMSATYLDVFRDCPLYPRRWFLTINILFEDKKYKIITWRFEGKVLTW